MLAGGHQEGLRLAGQCSPTRYCPGRWCPHRSLRGGSGAGGLLGGWPAPESRGAGGPPPGGKTGGGGGGGGGSGQAQWGQDAFLTGPPSPGSPRPWAALAVLSHWEPSAAVGAGRLGKASASRQLAHSPAPAPSLRPTVAPWLAAGQGQGLAATPSWPGQHSWKGRGEGGRGRGLRLPPCTSGEPSRVSVCRAEATTSVPWG